MNQVKKIKNLDELSYFDKNSLSQYIDIADNSLYANINRWIKNGKIIQLKKGLYVTSQYFDKLADKDAYFEFMANRLKVPSYLSMEYILSKYGILSESVFSYTIVTLKRSGSFSNKLGVFFYKNIKESLFDGYEIKERGGFLLKEASRAKALFDYFYYKIQSVSEIDRKWLKSYRLNLDQFNSGDWDMLDYYCRQAGFKKYLFLGSLLRGLND